MIGKKIAEIRKMRGYTLSELAEQSNISKSYLSNIERSIHKNPSLDVIQRIASVLQVDLLSILQAENNSDNPFYIEQEWIPFLKELKALGIDKDELKEYKLLIEFIKWKKSSLN